ncbi:MAG: tetratricopeptide repeat protein, partial [Candidatus Methylomirabilia bacterium]
QQSEFALRALSSLGWLAFQRDDPTRALARFDRLLKSGAPPAVIPFASHGRAMALYALGRYAEARQAWRRLANRSIPTTLVREVTFWLGESLGRVGAYGEAVEHLRRFTGGGPHRLRETGILRLGWWGLAAGRPAESLKAFSSLLREYPDTAERPWARAGLVRARLALGDFPKARAELRLFEREDSTHRLVLPTLFLLLRWSIEHEELEHIQAISQALLQKDLSPGLRSYVLFLNGEASRHAGRRQGARSQLEQVRFREPESLLGWRASISLARMDLEDREFSRARRKAQRVLTHPLTGELQSVTLLMQGEAAYRAKEYKKAVAAFRQFLSRFSGHPQAAAATFSLAWAEFRLGRLQEARQRWRDFAWRFPGDAHAGEALLLAAELTARAGDEATLRDLLDQVLSRYPSHPHAPVARLNRAVLAIRDGRVREGLADLDAFTDATPMFPFVGRVRLARGVALLEEGSLPEAAREFKEAIREGEGALAYLGLGSALLARGDREGAGPRFAEARDLGAEPVRRLGEYGLAVVGSSEDRHEELTRAARALVESPSASVSVPGLLYLLTARFVEGQRWGDARQSALRLVDEFPSNEAADDALARLGDGAWTAAEWELVRETYTLLLARYPGSPHAEGVHLPLGEALLKIGAADEAVAALTTFVDTRSDDPRFPDALMLLAEASEKTGNRPAAIDALARLVRDHPGYPGAVGARMSQARLLQEEGRLEESREVLKQVVIKGDPAVAAEAAFKLGEGLRSKGEPGAAVEFYMTAAYLSPETAWGQRALIGAGQSFAALGQGDAAASVFRKLLTNPRAEPDLAREAEEALSKLGSSSEG